MKIGLPISQYFEQVKIDLLPIAGAVSVRKEKDLDKDFEGKDVLFHANGFINDEFDALINNCRFLKKIQSRAGLLSFDLGPSCRKVGCFHNGYVAKSHILTEGQILKIADKKINNIRKYFKGIISVENLDYHLSGAYEIVCVPEFVDAFVKEFNVYLTLDIGHVEATCSNLSIDIHDYLERMPLSKVIEIHLSRSFLGKDSHELPDEKEYKLLDFVLKKSSANYIILEYYHDADNIIYGNKKLARFLKRKRCL